MGQDRLAWEQVPRSPHRTTRIGRAFARAGMAPPRSATAVRALRAMSQASTHAGTESGTETAVTTNNEAGWAGCFSTLRSGASVGFRGLVRSVLMEVALRSRLS